MRRKLNINPIICVETYAFFFSHWMTFSIWHDATQRPDPFVKKENLEWQWCAEAKKKVTVWRQLLILITSFHSLNMIFNSHHQVDYYLPILNEPYFHVDYVWKIEFSGSFQGRVRYFVLDLSSWIVDDPLRGYWVYRNSVKPNNLMPNSNR